MNIIYIKNPKRDEEVKIFLMQKFCSKEGWDFEYLNHHALLEENYRVEFLKSKQQSVLLLPLSLSKYLALKIVEEIHLSKHDIKTLLISRTEVGAEILCPFFDDVDIGINFQKLLKLAEMPRTKWLEPDSCQVAIATILNKAYCFDKKNSNPNFERDPPTYEDFVETYLPGSFTVAGRTLLINYEGSELAYQSPQNAEEILKRYLQGEISDLRRANFEGFSIENRQLNYVNFEWANMQDIQFDQCKLRRANFNKANLDHAYIINCEIHASTLGGSILIGAFFRNTQGPGCNFNDANMRGIIMVVCDLRESLFERTQLDMSNFAHCKLMHCDFSRAALEATKFHNCDLRDADFRLSNCSRVEFTDCNLTGIQVYDWIATDIIITGGEIEYAFLERDGSEGSRTDFKTVEEFYNLFKRLKADNEQRLNQIAKESSQLIFLSYSWPDKLTVLAVDQWLRNNGLRVILDERDFIPGYDLEDEIVKNLQLAHKVVAFYSQASHSRPWTKLERRITANIERRLSKAETNVRKLIYFRLDNTELPLEDDNRLAINAFELDFENACQTLLKAVIERANIPSKIDLAQFADNRPW